MDNFLAHILVVDDDEGIRSLVKKYLNENRYLITTAGSAEDAYEKIKIIKYDIIILDIMMPGKSGLEFIQENKKNLDTPIILLTAKGQANERVEGLEIGADDYLPKPFEPRELLARIQSILRRTHSSAAIVENVHFIGLSIDKNKQEVLLDDNLISLSTTEYEALLLFIENSSETLDREFLVENLRGITWQTYDRSVDVLVSRLRNKLGETPARTRFIKTIHGVGYKFIAVATSK